MDSNIVPAWDADWAWGLPSVVPTVVTHKASGNVNGSLEYETTPDRGLA